MIDNAFVAVCAVVAASRTWTVKLNVPAVVGVPPMTPPAFRVRPAGNVPETIDQVNGSNPLTAFKDCAYSTPVNPFGRDRFEIASGGVPPVPAILIEKAWEAGVLLALSATRTVKVLPPLGSVGVPEIRPVPGFKLNPEGRVPEVIDQV